jgi:hypothetical protein
MRVHGGCHCGAIRFEADVDPEGAGICHCTDCQVLSATAFRVNVPAKAEGFRVLRGEAKEYVKVGDSGSRRAQGFCGECGAQLYAANADGAREVYMLRVGVIDERRELTPKRQIWRNSAMPWLGNWPDLPAKPRG